MAFRSIAPTKLNFFVLKLQIKQQNNNDAAQRLAALGRLAQLLPRTHRSVLSKRPLLTGTEKAEQDYQDALQAVETIKISHDEYHKLTWELHQRLGEIGDLQKALSDAQAFLFEERRQLLRSMAENDELRGAFPSRRIVTWRSPRIKGSKKDSILAFDVWRGGR
jgi:hypothetical protein